MEIENEVRRIVKAGEVEKTLENAESIDPELIKKISDAVVKWNRDISMLLKTQFDLLSASTLQ